MNKFVVVLDNSRFLTIIDFFKIHLVKKIEVNSRIKYISL